MTDGAHTPLQRTEAVRELCDVVLSPAPMQLEQQAGADASTASAVPESAAFGSPSDVTNMPCWQVFSVAICRDNASVDSAWELM
jgi:hypothetical protein